MALRIRRGLSADRTSITPEQGEFLYTTDTYQVYIGDGVTAGGKPLYTLTTLGAIGLTDLSALSPLAYNNTTGQFSIQVATGSQAGYLASADFTTFNSKQNALEIFDETTSIITNPSQIKFVGTPVTATVSGTVVTVTISGTGGGGGGVTGVSVATANGFSGVSDLNATNPTLTLSTTITGLLKGNGTAVSAAVAGTDYQAALTGTGLVNLTAGTVSYVANNSTNWDTAYSQRISTFTTTGNSGAATFSGNVLNIPNYTAAGIGAVVPTRTIGTTTPLQGGGDLSADRTLSILQATTSQSGYLSSTDWNTFNGKQAALSGTGIVKSTAGTITYLTDNSANWDSAFGWGNHALAGYLTTTAASTTYVPQSRTITIDGTSLDLSADRSYTITKSLNDLSDVTLSSVGGGDLLQYSVATSQWVNVSLSALLTIGAANGLSFSAGNVILGGELDFTTTIATYNTTSTTQYSLTFTSGSSAYTSPGTAGLRVLDTSANVSGTSGFYVGALTNHAIFAEGRGSATTTDPIYTFERTSANLSVNSAIVTKSTNAGGIYTCVTPDSAFTGKTTYVTSKIPAVLIEKTTGLFEYSSVSPTEILEQPYDKFFRNQIYNLLTLRLSKGPTPGENVPYQGIEASFELQGGGTTGSVTKIASLKAYRVSNTHNGSEFSISTRMNTEFFGTARGQEYEGFRLGDSGIVTLPAYAEQNANNTFAVGVNSVTGAITSVAPTISFSTSPKTITYGDTVSFVVIDEAGTSTTTAQLSGQFLYRVERVRLTNRGSGYVTAPAVTFGVVGVIGTARLTSTGEIDYIEISSASSRVFAITTVTIAPPASGTQATGVVELGDGYLFAVQINTAGAGYTPGAVRVEMITQVRSAVPPPSVLGVDSTGKVTKFRSGVFSLDYILNSESFTVTKFGSGSKIVNPTTITSLDTLTINTNDDFEINSQTSAKVAASSDGSGLLKIDSEFATNPYLIGSSSVLLEASTSGGTNASLVLLSTKLDIPTSLENGAALSFLSKTAGTTPAIEFYLSSGVDTPYFWNPGYNGVPDFSGKRIGLKLVDDDTSYTYLDLTTSSLDFKLAASYDSSGGFGLFETGNDSLAFTRVESSLLQTSRAFEDVGGVYSITSSAYLSDDPSIPGALIGTYVSKIYANSIQNGGANPPGVKLSVENTYGGVASSIFINDTDIFIQIPTTATVTSGDVLTLTDNSTGQLGYTTLAAVATSGDYADLTGTPTIPTTLDSLTDVSAASPTNGQVLSYNTGASAWQAVTFSASGLTLRTNTVGNGSQSILDLKEGTGIDIVDDGVGGVTISATGGSGGVGLDSVFMLMGA